MIFELGAIAPGVDGPQRLAAQHVAFVTRTAAGNGSEFDRSIASSIQGLPVGVQIQLLLLRKYGALIFVRGEAVLGHVFYQRRDDALHVFSVWVADEFRGQGWASIMASRFLLFAYRQEDITAVRLGAGGHTVVEHLYHKALDGKFRMLPSWMLSAGGGPGWIHFNRANTGRAA